MDLAGYQATPNWLGLCKFDLTRSEWGGKLRPETRRKAAHSGKCEYVIFSL